MDLEGSTSRRNKKVFYNLLEIYPHDLQFFADPPHLDLPIDEFEKLAMERMHVLRIIQQASSVKGHQLLSNGWVNCISEALKEFRLNDYNLIIMNCGSAQSEASCAVRRRDHISHYILRLVYCRSEELRRWFLARETELFNLKCKMLKEEEIDKFLSFNKLNLSPISQQEKGDLRISLLYSTKNFNFDTDFYKVQFSDVPYLVKKKQVLLKDGFAIIPKKDLIHYIANNFKKMLRQALLYASKKMYALDDDRIRELLLGLEKNNKISHCIPGEYSHNSIDPSLMDVYAKNHFPLCMRNIHENFRATHTLKYDCRLQYGFFCKGIGLSYEDCVKYWRDEFTKAMEHREFQKKYGYTIKHNYGKVGGKINYIPFNCTKIISANVGIGQQHGCPFKVWDNGYLKQKLTEYGFGPQVVTEIVNHAKEGNYQMACSAYFEYMHGRPSKEVINHPNQYFEESFNYEHEYQSPYCSDEDE